MAKTDRKTWYLPQSLVEEILSRLPAKDLLRFKCVRKQWAIMINSRYFIKLHLKRTTSTRNNRSLLMSKGGLYSINLKTEEVIELDFPLKSYHPEYHCQILATCDGLLCLMPRFTYRHLNLKNDIVVWNMTTKEYRVLPAWTSPFPHLQDFAAFGFGYDSIRDDYKVVRILRFRHVSMKPEVQVYSLRNNLWRTPVASCPHFLEDFEFPSVAHVNGSLHWVVTRKLDNNDGALVIAFDLSTEDYSEVAFPDSIDRPHGVSVGELEGKLCMLFNYGLIPVDLWVMAEYGNKHSWYKLFSFAKRGNECYRTSQPLAMCESNSSILVSGFWRMYYWYDIKTEKFTTHELQVHVDVISRWKICLSSLVKLNVN